MAAGLLHVVVLSPEQVLFEGDADHVIAPGEYGVFEILPFHRPFGSLLLPGHLIIDSQALPIERGVLRVERDTVTALVELPPENGDSY
jgi:F0F1-type ATP synthase epsilon subunit